jgi:hypothetical protein
LFLKARAHVQDVSNITCYINYKIYLSDTHDTSEKEVILDKNKSKSIEQNIFNRCFISEKIGFENS